MIVPLLVCVAFVPDLRRLQNIIDEKAVLWNQSFSVGVYHESTGAFGAVAGLNDRVKRTAMTLDNRFPVGSVTKPWTCTAIMQANESGLIDLDSPIAQYVDPVLRRLNGTTMLELWNGNNTVNNITARRLMSMRAGINDYNDSWYHEVTLYDPDYDVTPFDILHRIDKTFHSVSGMSCMCKCYIHVIF